MDMHVLVNDPLEFPVGGRRLKAATLSVGEIYSVMEAEIRQQYINDMAKIQEKLDPKDRPEFAKLALQSMPRGRDLERQVEEGMMTVLGGSKLVHLAVSKHQQITPEEIVEMAEKYPAEMASLAAHVFGLGQAAGEEAGRKPVPPQT